MALYTASHVKDMNRLAVYNLVRERDEVTRTEISRVTGISVPTVQKIVEYLTHGGLLTETGIGHTGLGRKPQMFSHNKNRYYSIGIIHEGDDLRAGIANLDCEIICFTKVRARKPLGDILGATLFSVIDELIDRSGVAPDQLLGIGIGLPGIYDPSAHTISTAPLIGVPDSLSIEKNLRAIETRYNLGVLVENDLNLEVQGEYRALGLKGDLVYISLGTGLGSGVILGGELRRGKNNMCGEIGYMSFLRGREYAADKNQAGWLENQINIETLRKKFGIDGDRPIPGDTLRAAIDHVSDHLALCVNNIVMSYDCGNVSLGGEVFDVLGDALFDAVEEKVAALCVADVCLTKKVCCEPGITGAALMVYKHNIERVLSGDI